MKKHCFIFGYYRDYYDQSKQSVFLGSSYENAHARLNEVKVIFVKKSFFVFRRTTGIGYPQKFRRTLCCSRRRKTSAK